MEQGNFLKKYIYPYEMERKWNRLPNRKLRNSIQYLVRQTEKLLHLCVASFQSITDIESFRNQKQR